MGLKIGIPRAIQFYQHYPLWHTFFKELGTDTVVSPPTNREIVTAGAQVVADVTCLPIKIYAGHVCWLRDHGNVDFIFTPAIWNLEKEAFHCSKLKGLPDIIKAAVPDCPPLLVAEIDPLWRKLYEDEAFKKVGREITRNTGKIQRAWRQAKKMDADFRTLLVGEQITYPEALERIYGSELITSERIANQGAELVIGLVGHPYCLYDDYLNHNLVRRLGEMGVKVITSEMVPADSAARGVARTTRQTRWFFDPWMSGAAGYFLYEARLAGIIAAVAFGCGPDSTMVETINRRAHAAGCSFLGLILDEHGSATGMVTRLEAFVDMLRRQGRHVVPEPAKRVGERQNPGTVSTPALMLEGRRPVVGIPRMGTTAIPIKSVFTNIGAQVEMGPPISKQTVALGARSAPEFICTPYKQILGNMIELVEAGADTLIYVDGLDLCRNSAYHQLIEDALHDLGYKFTIITFSQITEGGLFAVPKFLRQFSPQLTWMDVVREVILGVAKARVLDEIERRVQYIRPREVVQGTVDKCWEEACLRIETVSKQEALQREKLDILNTMDRIEVDPGRRPVKIGLIGEIFAVLDPFYNQDIERQLGRAGAEVHRMLMISNWLKGEMILGALGLPHNQDVARAARPYLRAHVSGEAFSDLGETVLCAREGFDGMVELLPFTCEPEITALNILPRVCRDYNIPVIPFIFDEQSGNAGMRTRVEAYVDLLYRRRALAESSIHAVPPAELPGQEAGEDACTACPINIICPNFTPDPGPRDCKADFWRRVERSRV